MGIQRWRLKPSFNSMSQREDQANDKDVNIDQQEPSLKQSAEDQISDISQLGWRQLSDLISEPEHCQSCAEHTAILGEGNPNADWLFVIDSPSSKDTESGQLLSGRAGQLFESILRAIDLDRQSIYLTSHFKCPPSNEISTAPQCGDIVHRQLELVQPQVVVCLGEFTAQAILRSNQNLSALRTDNPHSILSNTNLLATHNVAELLENPALKAEVWADIQLCL